jgi:hypothetical protein
MADEQKLPPESNPPPAGTVNLGASDNAQMNIGGDVAGRDVLKSTTTNVGFGFKEVQRLVITVGVLVFVTALIFFSGGIAVGVVAFKALARPVNSQNPEAAARFEGFVTELRGLQSGQPFIFQFKEEEISSYFRLTLAPQIGVTDGKVRLLDQPGKLVVGGEAAQIGNLPFIAAFDVVDTPGAPLKLTSAAVHILQIKDSSFGWVFVPAFALQSIADKLNHIFTNVQISTVEVNAPAPDPVWTVTGVGQ